MPLNLIVALFVESNNNCSHHHIYQASFLKDPDDTEAGTRFWRGFPSAWSARNTLYSLSLKGVWLNNFFVPTLMQGFIQRCFEGAVSHEFWGVEFSPGFWGGTVPNKWLIFHPQNLRYSTFPPKVSYSLASLSCWNSLIFWMKHCNERVFEMSSLSFVVGMWNVSTFLLLHFSVSF